VCREEDEILVGRRERGGKCAERAGDRKLASRHKRSRNTSKLDRRRGGAGHVSGGVQRVLPSS